MSSFLRELKRRKVVRVAAVYAATAFVVLQAADLVLPGLLLPEWTYRMLVLLALFGFPVALVLAWAFELTPEGVRMTTSAPAAAGETPPALLGRRTAIVSLLLVAVGIGLGAGLFLAPAAHRNDPDISGGAADRSIAVLPFTDLSPAGDQKWFADGIAEEILTSLARLAELRVVGRSSSFLFAAGTLDDRVIADSLGVAYLVKGSVRRFGEQLRVSAQLVRAADGVQLWSESYDRDAAALLDVQRDVAEKVAAALDIFLDDSRRERMFLAGTRNVEAFEAYLRGREALYAANGGSLADADGWLARALALDPQFGRAALLYADRYAHRALYGPADPVADAADISDEEATERLRSALDLAARHSPDEYQRVIAAINREFFAPTWHRLPGLAEELRRLVNTAPSSAELNWSQLLLVVAGQLDVARAAAERALEDEPRDVANWYLRAQVEVTAGNLSRTRAILDEARHAVGEHPLFRGTEFVLAILSGDRRALIRLLDDTAPAAALQGDTTVLADARARARSDSWPDPALLWLFHELGDRQAARELARRVDALPMGAALLAVQVYNGGRHLTFDVDDTPNFRARLREAGVDPGSLRLLPRLGVEEQVR